MVYGKVGKMIRRVKKMARTQKARHQTAVRKAKQTEKQRQARVNAEQSRVAKQSKPVRAGDLLESGDWNWEGAGMDPDTMLQLQWTGSGWEYVPATQVKRTKTTPAGGNLQQCRGKTQDGSPCQNRGKCPIRGHKTNKV